VAAVLAGSRFVTVPILYLMLVRLFAFSPSRLLAWLSLLARSAASPYAFAAAFRRHHGIPPEAWRQ
jgi:hypothetical protein